MIREFTKGIVRENPVFVVLLGLCPALAVSARVDSALGMGAGVLFVLIGSNLTVSLLKDFIPPRIRIPAYLVIIAGFVTVLKLLMQAYTPGLVRSLGIFVDLIAVNCIILGRGKAFAGKSSSGASFLDALGMGLGFALALTGIALIREVLGSGTITLFPAGGFRGVIEIPGLTKSPVRVFGMAAGGFLVLGYLKALFDLVAKRKAGNPEEEETP